MGKLKELAKEAIIISICVTITIVVLVGICIKLLIDIMS